MKWNLKYGPELNIYDIAQICNLYLVAYWIVDNYLVSSWIVKVGLVGQMMDSCWISVLTLVIIT